MTKTVIPIILIILAVALFFTFTDSKFRATKMVLDVEKQYDIALSKSRELTSVRDTLLTQFNSFKTSDLDRLEKLLPNNVDNVRLILEINNIASRYGMVVRNIALTEDSSDDESVVEAIRKDLNTVSLSFSVSSSYENFLLFMGDLETSLRLVDIEKISFVASESDFYEYKVTITTYWLSTL